MYNITSNLFDQLIITWINITKTHVHYRFFCVLHGHTKSNVNFVLYLMIVTVHAYRVYVTKHYRSTIYFLLNISIYLWEIGRWNKETIELTLFQDALVAFSLSSAKGVYVHLTNQQLVYVF